MDKDNRDDFTFAKLSELKLPVTFRMYAIHCSLVLPEPTTTGFVLVRNSKAHGRASLCWRS